MNQLGSQDISYQKQKAAAGYYYQGQAMDKIWIVQSAGAIIGVFRSRARADEAVEMIAAAGGRECEIVEVKVSQ